MNSIEVFIFGLVLLVFLLNFIASIFILRDEALDRFKIIVQLLIIWLLPLVGSIIIISLLWSYRDTTHKTDTSSNSGGYMVDSAGGGSD